MNIYQDIPRLYTAIAEWLGCMIPIYLIGFRFSRTQTVSISAGFLLLQGAFLYFTGNLSLLLWLPCMIGAVGLMYLMIILLGKVSFLQAGYLTVAAFLFAEFAASFEWQLYLYFKLLGFEGKVAGWIFLIFLYGGMTAAFFFIEKPRLTDVFLSQLTVKELITAILLTVLIFAFSNIGFITSSIPFAGTLRSDMFNVRTLVDLAGIASFVAVQSRVGELIAEREAANARMLFRSQYIQYKNYQESMDYIHMKYHDLKHQITGLRAETDAAERERWLDAMEKELDEHELVEPTGNQILDAVLGAKLLLARKNDIRMTYVINGSLLSMISVNDLCSIFGNAIDNALESVMCISDAEKRLIHMSVSEKKGYLVIEISNYIDEQRTVDLSDVSGSHLPSTTKADKCSHGFGLKSIKSIVQKYGGQMFINVKQNWFDLKIVIPMKE